jgi:hypothetical protein
VARIRAAEVERTTNDPQLREQLLKDMGHRSIYSFRELLQFWLFARSAPACARALHVIPVLMVQGLADRIVKPNGSCVLFRRLDSENKELVLLENSEHITFQEVRPPRVMVNLVLLWMHDLAIEGPHTFIAPSPSGLWIGDQYPSHRAEKLFKMAGIKAILRVSTLPAQ